MKQQVSESASQRVSSPGGTFDEARVNAALAGTIFAGKLHHFTSVDSTQTRALRDAQAGAEAGRVYLADEQTAGRGRGGHTWHSAPDTGLYMSVLVRPQVVSSDVLRLSLATAIAVRWAIHESTGLAADVRWPNDLVVTRPGGQSRKLGGILTESAALPSGAVRHAVIGIGLNLNAEAFPADLAEVATSLRIETGKPVARESVAASILKRLDAELHSLQSPKQPTGAPSLFERFEEVSSWVRGKRVRVAEDEGYTGVTDGLTQAGLLRVRCDDGTQRTVRHGGVRESN